MKLCFLLFSKGDPGTQGASYKACYYTVRANTKKSFQALRMLLLGDFEAAVINQSLLIGYAFLTVIGFSVNMSSSLRKVYLKVGKYQINGSASRTGEIL